MSRRWVLPALATILLTVLAVAAFLLPAPLGVPASHAAAPPPTLRLVTTVRDFKKSHTDFDEGDSGHCAGNLDALLDADDRPVFTGNGFLITDEWEDDAGRPISPHLCGDISNPRLAVSTKFHIEGGCDVDSYDSRLGPYGAGNAGSAAVLGIDTTANDALEIESGGLFKGNVLIGAGGSPGSVVNNVSRVTGTVAALPQPLALPTLELPTDVGANQGDKVFENDGTIDITANQNWGDTRMVGTTFRFHGDRTILVDGWLDLQDDSVAFVFEPGASLTLYVTEWMEIDDGASLNMGGGEPSLLTICMTGTYPGSGDEATTGLLDIEDASQVTADVVAPAGHLLMENGCDLFGTFVGRTAELRDDSHVHVDLAVRSTGCASGDGPAGSIGGSNRGQINSAASFAEWFTNHLGTNLTGRHIMTLEQGAGGVWEHLDASFHPIDGQLLGNEGAAHNDYYTIEIDAMFTYAPCTGQFLEFAGGDGAWIFIDGRMYMDLGGVNPGTSQYLDLDRLGLEAGQRRFRMFYAHRSADRARLDLRTNIDLITTSPLVEVTGGFD